MFPSSPRGPDAAETADVRAVPPAEPFPGIEPFALADAPVFFSRETEVRALVRQLVIHRAMILFAASGTGKSSLINAGVIPMALDEGFSPERIRVQPHPEREILIEPLARDAATADLLPPSIFVPDRRSGTVLSVDTFLDTVRQATRIVEPAAHAVPPGHAPAGPRVLLIFDQFEEWSTAFEEWPAMGAADARSAQDRMRAAIVDLITDSTLRVKVLLSLREDYLATLTPFFDACPELTDTQFRLVPLNRDQVLRTIRGPFDEYPGRYAAERTFTPALAERIRDDLAQRAKRAPISLTEVQIVCRSLFEDPSMLAKFEPGRAGVKAVLEAYLTDAIDRLDTGHRAQALKLLTSLINPSGTRRSLQRDALLEIASGGDPKEMRRCGEALDALEKGAKLVRRESRMESVYYELASEFLVDWVREKAHELRQELHRQELAKAQRILRRRVGGLVVVLLGMLAVGVLLVGKNRDSQAYILALAADRNITVDVERSLLLALEAVRLGSWFGGVPETGETALRRALVAAPQRRRIAPSAGQVSSMALSPDGRWLAVVQQTGVRLCNTTGPAKPFCAEPTGGAFIAAAFTGDGRELLGLVPSDGDSGNTPDTMVKRWLVPDPSQDNATLVPVGEPRLLNVQLFTGQFNADGRCVIGLPQGRTNALAISCRGEATRIYGRKGVSYAALDDKGETFAWMSDQNIVIEDLKTGRPVRTVDASSLSGTTGLTFSRDLTRLLVISKVSSPVLWNLEQGGAVALAAAGSLGSFSADGMRLVTGGDQQPFDIWDAGRGRHLGRIGLMGRSVTALVLDNTGTRLLTADSEGEIWEATGDVAFAAHPRAVRGLAVNFDGTRAVSVGEDGDVSLWAWDGHAARQMRVVKPAPQQAQIAALAIAPDGHRFAVASKDLALDLYDDNPSSERVRLASFKPADPDAVIALAFDREGRQLAALAADGKAILWSVTDRQARTTLKATGPVSVGWPALSFDRPGTCLWAAGLRQDYSGYGSGVKSATSGISLRWNLSTPASPAEPMTCCTSDSAGSYSSLPVNRASRPAIAADGDHALLLFSDPSKRKPEVWEWPANRRRITLREHRGEVTAIAVSPDGQLLVTAGNDGTVTTWDADDSRQIVAIGAGERPTVALAFSGDGRQLVLGLDDGVILFSSLISSATSDLESRIEEARSRVTRPLSAEECSAYLRDETCGRGLLSSLRLWRKEPVSR